MNATVLVGVEVTTPQSDLVPVREEFDVDEEDFVDVNIMNNATVDEQPDSNPLISDDAGDDGAVGGDDSDNDNAASGMVEMAPSHRPAEDPSHPNITRVRSRRNKPGGSGGYSDDSGASGGGSTTTSSRLCLKRKKSRNGPGGDYERIDDRHAAEDALSPHSVASSSSGGRSAAAMGCGNIRRFCLDSSRQVLRTTVSVMNFVARILLWGSFIAMIVGVVWYSRELKMNGTDSHLIAWFSAGAFVILGFPIAMCGIIMHLKNYYQPNVQCYVVRILWMVPIYSIESWLCLRFHTYAIYVETLRDFYESFVLLSFFQFLVEVLGGEEALVLMLKDKSPTRGVHIWGLGYCVRPWVMGQPVSMPPAPYRVHHGPTSPPRAVKRVRWTSPFFVRCKFGVLQYVLIKAASAMMVMVLEIGGIYKEGDFTPRGGYLYICIVTNLSQCWALYCLVFFYYALKNELGPIRPVGKFISVKALVFFTWWQSLGISILFQMGMIPHYTSFDNGREWTSEAVAKGLQDWLICIEMFIAAIVHTFVFPHTDYLEPLGIVQRAGHHTTNGVRRLGRKGRHGYRRGWGDDNDKSTCSKSSGEPDYGGCFDVELGPGISPLAFQEGREIEPNTGDCSTVYESDRKDSTDSEVNNLDSPRHHRLVPSSRHERQGFVRALLDSTLLPRDVLDESVGVFKGEFNVEKKTLLQHATTSDEYDLFSRSTKRQKAKLRIAHSPAASRKNKEIRTHAPEGVPDSVLIND